MKNALRHLSSFIAPIAMCFVLPYFILMWEHNRYDHSVIAPPVLLVIPGIAVAVTGFSMLVITIRMFLLMGNGTIMPWDPTQKLIVTGLYRHVRNPMIAGIVLVQAGEAMLFSSWGIAALAALNFILNTVYFIYSEEPGLAKRFGQEYIEYKRNVPRWIPRLKPWGTK